MARRCRLETARSWLLSGGSTLFFGGGGIGKSAALDMLIAACGDARLLRCAPSAEDAIRPYRGLACLLSTVSDAELELLPITRRRALVAALARRVDRADRNGAAPHRENRRWGTLAPATVGLAALQLLRMLAQARPLLLVADDLQWLDPASAEALRFVATRVGDLPVHMIAAERVSKGHPPVGRFLCPAPLLVVRLDPLTTPSLAELVRRG